jgi:O-glycosyl hydrolase
MRRLFNSSLSLLIFSLCLSVVRSAGVAGVNFTASVAAPANLVVDVAKRQQTIDGMGVNINVNSWKNGQLTPALDALIDINGSSAFRVIRDPMTWVGSESLIPALHKLDLPTLQSVYETPAMQDLWNTIGYLNKKGILGKQIILNFMGWTPIWLGGSGVYGQPSHITAGKEQSFATMVASLVYYGRTVKGLNFTYLSPLNEEDWDCKEGPCASASQYAVLMMDLATELNAMGLTDVRFIAPETAGDPSAYIASIQSDNTVFAMTDHLTFHAYGGSRSPGQSHSQKNYWVTETGAECSSCDYSGTPSQGEWAFASQTNDAILDDLANGISSVLIYDGYDSFYYHHNAYGFWGLLAYDQANGLYSPRKRFYVNSQINRFITPGAQMVSLSDSVSGLDHAVAFYNLTTQKVTIVGHNSASSPTTISGQINSLPLAVTSMNVYETNIHLNFQQGSAVPVAGGIFQLTVPADTFFSLSN